MGLRGWMLMSFDLDCQILYLMNLNERKIEYEWNDLSNLSITNSKQYISKDQLSDLIYWLP